MYPTGQKIGINSVENTFLGGKRFFFFFDISGNKDFEQGGKHFIYFEQNENHFIYFHIFLNPPPPPPVIKWSAP